MQIITAVFSWQKSEREKEKYKQTHVQKLCVKRVCAIETHFFIEIYTSNSTRKWCEKKNLARNQWNGRNIFAFYLLRRNFRRKKIYSLRLGVMIREHKSMTSTWFGYVDFFEKVWSLRNQSNDLCAKMCECVCLFEFYMRHIIAFHVKIGKLLVFFSSSLQYSITRMPFIPFAFNNIVSTNGIGQSEYVLSVLICGFHSQS